MYPGVASEMAGVCLTYIRTTIQSANQYLTLSLVNVESLYLSGNSSVCRHSCARVLDRDFSRGHVPGLDPNGQIFHEADQLSHEPHALVVPQGPRLLDPGGRCLA
jgi:hypothetical protein